MLAARWVWTAVSAVLLLVGLPAHAKDSVSLSGYSPGTIVVRTSARSLYLVTDTGRAVRYTVGVGRSGKQWFGTTESRQQAYSPGVVAPR